MASAVNFRMHHGAENSQQSVNFVGNGIRVLDLKREILERKKFSPTTDFDLKIVDQSGKVYDIDDEYIPKNSSLVVRRIPTKSAATSLIARLKGNFKGGSAASNLPVKTDIVMPVKAEAEPLIVSASAPVRMEAAALASSEMLTEEENDALNQISQRSTTQIGGNRTWVNDAVSIPTGGNQGTSGLAGITRRQGGGVASSGGHGAGYVCRRCGKAGHFLPNCPTNGDPAYENKPAQNQKLMNTSQGSRKIVATLEGIETKNKTVNQLADGRWEIFESSQSGLMRLTRESECSTTLNIDMKEVPEYLKCPISNTFLKEAVSLPCCKQCVNDSIVRQQLLTGGLKCPLCGAANISTDALMTRIDIRNSVDSYIRDKTKKAAAVAAAENAAAIAITAAAAAAYVPTPLIKTPSSPAIHIPVINRIVVPAMPPYEIPIIVPMRPPPPPGGPPPSNNGSGISSGMGPGSLMPVGFAPLPPQPAQRSEMMLGQGLQGQGHGQQGGNDYHQGSLMVGPPRHMIPGMAMSGGGGGGGGGFYPPGMMAPNMVMMMQGQGQGSGLGPTSDIWAMQQAQVQSQKHMGGIGIGIPPMQHLGLMSMAEHQQGMPAIPDGWMWGPNGPIPPRDFFVAPMSREEFIREQNAQLEELRRRDEKRNAMARERNEQRNQQGGRGSVGGRGGGRVFQEQGQDARYTGGSSSRRNRDQSHPPRSDEQRDTRDRVDGRERRDTTPKIDRDHQNDTRRRDRSISRDSKVERVSSQGSDVGTSKKLNRRSSSVNDHNDNTDGNDVDRKSDVQGDEQRAREKEKEAGRSRERPRDAERERRDRDIKEKQKEKEGVDERTDRDREREKERERERERQKEKERAREKEKDKEMKKLEREKGERADREKVREQQDRDKEKNRTREVEREKDKTREVEREKDRTKELEREKDKTREVEREKDKTREVEREKDRTRELEREKDRTREVEREKDRTREVEREKDRTREVEREKDRTREVEREKDRTREVEKERKVRDSNRSNGHEDRNKDRGSAKGGSKSVGSNRDVATDRKPSRNTNEDSQTSVKDREKDSGKEIERGVRDGDRGTRSRPNDEDSRISTSTGVRKRDRDEPVLQDRDRDRDREDKNGTKRTKTADLDKSSRARGGDREKERGNSRDNGGSECSLRSRQAVSEDQSKSDRSRTKDKNQDNSERSAPSLNPKGSRNGIKSSSQRELSASEQSPQQPQQGNGGFYTSKFKGRSVVADSSDSRKGKQRDDGEDRWEMRKN